jgi:hypothetical protein
LDGARHLARGDGYVSAYSAADHTTFDPITHWAPGTSLLIACGIRLGLEPLSAAALVLGACYAAAVLLVFVLGVELAGRRYWIASLLVSSLFALQPSTLRWMNALLSDLPNATFLLLNVWLTARVMRSERASLRLRVAWGVGLAAMAVIRYAGMLYVPGLLVATALGMRSRSLRARAWSFRGMLLARAAGAERTPRLAGAVFAGAACAQLLRADDRHGLDDVDRDVGRDAFLGLDVAIDFPAVLGRDDARGAALGLDLQGRRRGCDALLLGPVRVQSVPPRAART